MQSGTIGAVLPETNHAPLRAVMIRYAAGASNPNEEFFGDGSE
jgi:hypothetical protein